MNVAELPHFYPALPDDASARPARPADVPAAASSGSFAETLARAVAPASDALARAAAAEHDFVHGGGDLQRMVLERAQASVALSIASALATHTAQALSTVFGMQL